jgi:tRNA A-37 threonylcarbamoyl transferase component Bud32
MTALRTGDRLGAYEIVGLVGHGAMGEIYRAGDTRLGREVAVKVLPTAFLNDAGRLGRLEREARLISQVSHPNICTLYDIVESAQAPCLILELVEGETLQELLLRGPMTLRDALRCASAIASALEAAHSKGIIHRDLKPSNIKLTAAGHVKVLDFGVAKLMHGDSGFGAPEATLALGGTKEGALVGTVAYVSPEQAMGDHVDARSDIWAFGCLLYEMLTAKRAFPGVAVADTLGAVMRGEPDWTALPAGTPSEVRTLLRRCLEKDRTRRLANIADARIEIDDVINGRSHAAAISRPRGRLTVALAFIGGAIFASLMARIAFDDRAQQPAPVALASAPAPVMPAVRDATPPASAPAAESRPQLPRLISLPVDVAWARAVDDGVPNTILAISPDGRRVVFSARTESGTALWLRSLASDNARELPGTEGGISPFWSPDSKSIGFFADRQLKRLDLDQPGVPTTLCKVRTQRGGTWGPDDTIVFSTFSGGLKLISARGGPVTSLAHPQGEAAHVRPHFLAGTRQILYRVTSGNGRNNRYYITSLDSFDRSLIATLDSGMVTYAQGHLLYMQNHTLMAQPFDPKRLTTIGSPKPLANGVLLSPGSMPVFGVFSASPSGPLVYLSEGSSYNDPMTVLSDWATAFPDTVQ